MKRALITGISGQDGSYLAELLIEKGYEVWGIIRRHSQPENQTSRLKNIFDNDRLHLEYGDVTDLPSLISVVQTAQPHEVYNLAAQSHVKISFDQPVFTTITDSVGVLNVLEAVKVHSPTSRVYQAGSSEMFGNESDPDGYRRETTLMRPVSPYGCAKVYAYNLGKVYRTSYDMFVSNGILFNHESPRRGLNFVTNKVVDGAIKISKGLEEDLALGNLAATRDWGHAKDYVKAMWMMLQHEEPDDFVCATGKSHSVEQLCDAVFSYLDLDWRAHVTIDPKYYRPTELTDLKGDCSKLKNILGWTTEYTFEKMIAEMIETRLATYNDKELKYGV